VSTAADAGLIEVVSDAVSLHHLREKWAELKWPPGIDSQNSRICYTISADLLHKMAVAENLQACFVKALIESDARCNTRQHTATHGNTRQHTATHGNTRQRTATHGNTL